ncbi:MAG: hypothetical protein CL609_04030 [Anaerolineaceae bacterium]|nr:hypothetical protein [Anaerolineaceae bacterium]
MSDEISVDVFNHLVTLAALELDEKQAAYLRRELNQQLKAIHELAAIPLEADVTVAAHGVPYTKTTSPQLREDEWIPFPNPAEILAQAPQVEESHIVVPDIPHQKLD